MLQLARVGGLVEAAGIGVVQLRKDQPDAQPPIARSPRPQSMRDVPSAVRIQQVWRSPNPGLNEASYNAQAAAMAAYASSKERAREVALHRSL